MNFFAWHAADEVKRACSFTDSKDNILKFLSVSDMTEATCPQFWEEGLS